MEQPELKHFVATYEQEHTRAVRELVNNVISSLEGRGVVFPNGTEHIDRVNSLRPDWVYLTGTYKERDIRITFSGSGHTINVKFMYNRSRVSATSFKKLFKKMDAIVEGLNLDLLR